jgi:hypothetical protein
MDQPRPLFIVIALAALIAIAASVYVSVVAASSVEHPPAAIAGSP